MPEALIRIFLFFLCLVTAAPLKAQDSLFTREVIRELTSEKYHGRGYVKGGDRKAADYLASTFRRLGLSPLPGAPWLQPFSFPVNTFPGKMLLRLDDRLLRPGYDFIVAPGMSSLKGTFGVVVVQRPFATYTSAEIKGKFICIDTTGNGFRPDKEDLAAWRKNSFGAAGMLFVQPLKLTWSVSTREGAFPVLDILKSAIPHPPAQITVDIISAFIPHHQTANVLGYLQGSQQPDSFLFVTAHYDHLGRMGNEAIFPGANDNASGISMLLNLASYFADPAHRHRYSLVFAAFAGEEAGLLGSEYFTKNPPVPLAAIRFLLNLDLLGTGDDGMMVVNATEFPQAFELLDSINTARRLLPKIGQRGKAANSDHYHFTEKGVPAFFCYTLGGISAYHDVHDIAATLPLTRYREVFELLHTFLALQ